jgi:SnoaL-like domain
MPRENEVALRTALDAFNRRDKAAWLAIADPEAVNFPPREWPENAPIHGAGAIYDFYVEAMNAWEEASFDWGEIIDVGNGQDRREPGARDAGQVQRCQRRMELLGCVHVARRTDHAFRVVRGQN